MAIQTVLVTGAAGFIGFHLCQRLLDQGQRVVGLDNLNDYYDVRLKQGRLALLQAHPLFSFQAVDLGDRSGMAELFASHAFSHVAHLAAQAGVRYSLQNPHAYVDSNLVGFVNILEGCRHHGVEHLVYASSSSVYGSNRELPFAVEQSVDHPISLYAATKKANELMAHTYSHLYGLPTTGLRFFTVYGPWGRPDMAPFLFTKAILEGQPIQVFNHGQMKRDFTYVSDVAEAVARALDVLPEGVPEGSALTPGTSTAPYRVYNLGNHEPVPLLRFIEVLEEAIGRPAVKEFLPMQPGDVMATYADIEGLRQAVGFSPSTPIEQGIPEFVGWYRDYYGV